MMAASAASPEPFDRQDRQEDVLATHRYDQPIGEDGVRYSLEQVAEYASEGRFEPRVISWTTHELANAGFPKSDIEKARVIHNGILRDICWVQDPVDSELIRNPRLMLPDPVTGEKAMFPAGDCDDISATELACMMSVGLRAAALGHSYEDDEQIGHVLGEVWDSAGKRWHFIDGSSRKLKFGEAFEPTRSRRIELPTKMVTCDTSGQCPIGTPPSVPGDNIQFVGLAGAGKMVEEGGRTVSSVVGQISTPTFAPGLAHDEAFDQGFEPYLKLSVEKAERAWESVLRLHDGMRSALKIMGLNISSPEFQGYWSAAQQEMLTESGVESEILVRAVRDVLAGKRSLELVGPEAERDLGFTALDSDEVFVTEDAQGLLHLSNRDSSPHHLVSAPSGALAGVKWHQGADVPVVGTALMLKTLTDYFEEVRRFLDLTMQQFLHEQERAAKTPLEQRRVLEASQTFASAEQWSESATLPPEPEGYKKAVTDSFSAGFWALGGLAALVGGVAAVGAISNWQKKLLERSFF